MAGRTLSHSFDPAILGEWICVCGQDIDATVHDPDVLNIAVGVLANLDVAAFIRTIRAKAAERPVQNPGGGAGDVL